MNPERNVLIYNLNNKVPRQKITEILEEFGIVDNGVYMFYTGEFGFVLFSTETAAEICRDILDMKIINGTIIYAQQIKENDLPKDTRNDHEMLWIAFVKPIIIPDVIKNINFKDWYEVKNQLCIPKEYQPGNCSTSSNRPLLKTPLLETPILETSVRETSLLEIPLQKKPHKNGGHKKALNKTPLLETPAHEMPVLQTPLLKKPLLTRPLIEGEDPKSLLDKNWLKKLKESKDSAFESGRLPCQRPYNEFELPFLNDKEKKNPWWYNGREGEEDEEEPCSELKVLQKSLDEETHPLLGEVPVNNDEQEDFARIQDPTENQDHGDAPK